MAIFWNHIKGTGNATSNNTGLWTWIEWSKAVDVMDAATVLTSDLSPEIKIKIGNGSPDKNLGNIVTTNANITTYGNWIHKNVSTWQDQGNNAVFKIEPRNAECQISGYNGIHFDLIDRQNSASFTWNFDGKTNLKLGVQKCEVYVDTHIVNSDLKVDKKCEANFFNATSDKRAKENIQPATFSGLDLINKLSLYTFNYKSSADTVPGILAQDLLEVQPEGLDLVDNIYARGKDNDYMSIKESKLIFVLMQAIKEQQAQIEDLKAQIKNLIK